MIYLKATSEATESGVDVVLDAEIKGNGKEVLCELSSILVDLMAWDLGIFTKAFEIAMKRRSVENGKCES